MPSKPLKIIFHMNAKDAEEEYLMRFNNPSTLKLGIFTKPDAQGNKYEMFTCITMEMMLLSQKITDLIFKLEQIIQPIPPIAIRQFFTACLREEIQATNAIEGVFSTRKEIDYALDQQQFPSERKNTRFWGIVNKYQKLISKEDIPFSTCEDLRKFYDDFAADEVIHDDPRNTPDGDYFRKNSVSVNDGMKTIHVGLYPEEEIISTMTKALNILNNESIPLFIRVSLFHYIFGFIHPFYDGNGRTSRFISSYYLTHNKNPLLAIRLSGTIKRGKRLYYKLFEGANNVLNKGELTHFVLGFLSIYEKSLLETIKILERKTTLYQEYLECLNAKIKNKNELKIYTIMLQASLFSDHAGASLKEIANTTGVHENTVQRKLSAIEDHVIVHREHRAYRYELNIQSFFGE